MVICPSHRVLLRNTCQGCWEAAPCFFRAAGGWLALACSHCVALPYPPDKLEDCLQSGRTAAFDVLPTPALVALVAALQRDLQAALLGRAPRRSWGFVRSGAGLLQIVADLSFCIVVTAGMRFDPRADFVRDRSAALPLTVLYQPFTPAVLTPYAAFGMLAITAAVLDSLEAPDSPSHRWGVGRASSAITAASFTAWVKGSAWQWLQVVSRSWDPVTSAAFQDAALRTEGDTRAA